MQYGISLSKTGKHYILAQIRYAEGSLYYVQVKHHAKITKPYGFSFYVQCGNKQFKEWLLKQNYSNKSLAEEGTTPYVSCYIRPRSKKGLINMQIFGTPLNRKWGAAKRFQLFQGGNVMVGKIHKTMRMGIAQKDPYEELKKVFAIVSFGNKSGVTCASCQAQEDWGLGGWVTDSRWERYIQTYLPCYTCGKVLSHPLRELEVLGQVDQLEKLKSWMLEKDYYKAWMYRKTCGCIWCTRYAKKCSYLGLDPDHAYKGVNL